MHIVCMYLPQASPSVMVLLILNLNYLLQNMPQSITKLAIPLGVAINNPSDQSISHQYGIDD